MGSMEQHFVMISDSMEKHGEHGTAFSHDFRQHGRSMGSMVTPHFMTLNSMEKHGKHGTAFSHNFRQHGKAWGAWKSIFS